MGTKFCIALCTNGSTIRHLVDVGKPNGGIFKFFVCCFVGRHLVRNSKSTFVIPTGSDIKIELKVVLICFNKVLMCEGR